MDRAKWLILSIIFFVMFSLVYANSHPESIFKYRAEYYLKKGDYKNAEKMYEQGFEAGLHDLKSRNNYLNLVIKKDSDSDEQEKLLKFLKYDIEDSAKYAAETRIEDVKEELKSRYEDTYIGNAPYNNKIIRWADLPITYYFYNTDAVPAYYMSEIDNAFKTWEMEIARRVYFEKDDKAPNIVIRFNTKMPSGAENEEDKYVVAYTNPVISGNRLKNMVMDFYVQNADGEYYSENEIYNTALHEISHALGVMGHSEYTRDIMHMTMNPEIVADDLRAKLSMRDMDTIALLYNIKPDLTNKDVAACKYTPEVVLGGEKNISSAKIREAKNYIRKAPNLPAGYIDLAEALVSVKEYSKAIKSLQKALKFSDSEKINGMIYYNLAVVYNLLGDYDNAQEYISKAIKIQDSESCHQLLADIYTSEGKIAKAIEEYKFIIEKNPSNPDYTIALTNIYIKSYKYMSARKVLKNYFQKYPSERKNPRFGPYGIIKLGL